MVPAIALLLLYARLDAAALLAHRSRRELLARLDRAPGLTVTDVARALEVDYKTALHHVRMLARAGRVVVRRDGRFRRCYLPGSAVEGVPPPPPRSVRALHAVAAGAGTPAQLGRALAVPRGTAGSLLAALVQRGLLAREDAGHRLTEAARDALAPAEPFSAGPGMGRSWKSSSCAR